MFIRRASANLSHAGMRTLGQWHLSFEEGTDTPTQGWVYSRSFYIIQTAKLRRLEEVGWDADTWPELRCLRQLCQVPTEPWSPVDFQIPSGNSELLDEEEIPHGLETDRRRHSQRRFLLHHQNTDHLRILIKVVRITSVSFPSVAPEPFKLLRIFHLPPRGLTPGDWWADFV